MLSNSVVAETVAVWRGVIVDTLDCECNGVQSSPLEAGGV
jgi:hypothetical protein